MLYRLAEAVSSLPGIIINDGKIVIVDDFTGRVMPDRSWRDGLHQAVEAKEGVEVTDPKDTYARISFQRFFRLYKHLAGSTASSSAAAPARETRGPPRPSSLLRMSLSIDTRQTSPAIYIDDMPAQRATSLRL